MNIYIPTWGTHAGPACPHLGPHREAPGRPQGGGPWGYRVTHIKHDVLGDTLCNTDDCNSRHHALRVGVHTDDTHKLTGHLASISLYSTADPYFTSSVTSCSDVYAAQCMGAPCWDTTCATTATARATTATPRARSRG